MIRKISVLFLMLVSLQMIGQTTSSSPYSFYGLGVPDFKGTIENRLMGGIEVFSDSIHTNIQNPAGLAELKLINYSLGAGYISYDQKTTTTSQKSTLTAVDYLALGIPMGKLVVSFGIMPKSAVGYRLETNSGESILRNTGEGGTNSVFASAGYNLFEGFNIGVEANYNFGSIENNTLLYQEGTEFATREINESTLSGFAFKFGATYKRKISNELELHSSFSITPQSNLNSENERRIASVLAFQSGQVSVVEEIDVNVPNTEFTLPTKWTLGAGIGKAHSWFAGFEYSSQQKSTNMRRIFDLDNVEYTSSSSYKIGGLFVPNYRSISSYFNRVTYRAGFRYEELGLKINGEDISEFGISFGATLPMGRLFSKMNIGAEYGQRGTTSAGLVQEDFISIFVGLSLNDRWFQKRLYD